MQSLSPGVSSLIRTLTLFLLTLLVLTAPLLAIPLAATASSHGFADLDGHWARAQVEGAHSQGWVNGYPDGTFRPDGTITRAEFAKLIAAAVRITPGSRTAQFLTEASRTYADNSTVLSDMQGHWLSKQGWLQPLLAAGLIIPADYWEGRFEPDRPISRQEIAVMAARALGLVAQAERDDTGPARFADWDRIPAGARGYVGAVHAEGVVGGYPDLTFGPDRTATRAEAAVVVGRVLERMSMGLDPQIMVFIRKPTTLYPNEAPQAVELIVPAQVVDGLLYVPVRAVYEAAALKLYPGAPLSFTWDPQRQTLSFTYGMPHVFRPGANIGIIPPEMEPDPPPLPAASRLLFGEVMIPAYSPGERAPLWTEDPVWEPVAKILVLSVRDPSLPYTVSRTEQ